MLAIVLQILKILGIIILVLIGILVSGILILLFVPVRYHAKGYYRETYEVRAKVTWLLHVVSAQVVYSKEQALLLVIKLFGVTVFHNQKREAKRLAKETRKTKTEETKVVVENLWHVRYVKCCLYDYNIIKKQMCNSTPIFDVSLI